LLIKERDVTGNAYDKAAEIPANGPHPTISTIYIPIPKGIIKRAPTTTFKDEPNGAWDKVIAVLRGKLTVNEADEEVPILEEPNPWEANMDALGVIGEDNIPIKVNGPENAKDHELADKPTKLNIPEIAV